MVKQRSSRCRYHVLYQYYVHQINIEETFYYLNYELDLTKPLQKKMLKLLLFGVTCLMHPILKIKSVHRYYSKTPPALMDAHVLKLNINNNTNANNLTTDACLTFNV